MIGSGELSKSDRDQRLVMLVVADYGTHWYGRGDGEVVALAMWMASFPDSCVLLVYVFHLLLIFRFVFRSQINICSFESRLLSRTPAGVWFWMVSPLFIRLNLLSAFSCSIVYQPMLITLTLMSVKNYNC